MNESGDHVFRDTEEPAHRFLCLLGCWFQNPAYLRFHDALERFKSVHLTHHPDEPVTLHREDIINARKSFKALCVPVVRESFDNDLLQVVQEADFRIFAAVIDKDLLRKSYGDASAHPYHLALGFMLQRFAGYLNHYNRVGDVMAESRGGTEDRLLKDSYQRVYQRGVWGVTNANFFQSALTSKEIKLKQKSANIAGLQLSDLLAHPVKQWISNRNALTKAQATPFAQKLIAIAEKKFNRHEYEDRTEGYGWCLYPKK